MKISRLFLPLGLVTAFLAVACAPAVTTSPAVVDKSSTPVSVDLPVLTTTPFPVQPEATLAPTQTALPVATSRGPELHATDPSTVSLAAGQLQLVEFFRFT